MMTVLSMKTFKETRSQHSDLKAVGRQKIKSKENKKSS